jgi:ribonucleoside-triphosphate reductase (formate)
MDTAKESLEFKRIYIEEMTEKGLYPYSKFYLKNIKVKQGGYWANHFSTIGLVGMNELLLNFVGKPITDLSANALAVEILDYMREKMLTYQDETGNLYNLETTPAEGTSYRLAKKDQRLYPEIIFANDKEVKLQNVHPYYTNSTQLPVLALPRICLRL